MQVFRELLVNPEDRLLGPPMLYLTVADLVRIDTKIRERCGNASRELARIVVNAEDCLVGPPKLHLTVADFTLVATDRGQQWHSLWLEQRQRTVAADSPLAALVEAIARAEGRTERRLSKGPFCKQVPPEGKA